MAQRYEHYGRRRPEGGKWKWAQSPHHGRSPLTKVGKWFAVMPLADGRRLWHHVVSTTKNGALGIFAKYSEVANPVDVRSDCCSRRRGESRPIIGVSALVPRPTLHAVLRNGLHRGCG
jgi:hypothetical protein